MINKNLYIHKLEEETYKDMMNSTGFNEDIMFYYKNYTEKMKKPDLLGKTIKVTNKQFGNIFDIVAKIAKLNNMSIPDVYVYEDFYYGIESKGSENPWIEISAKTIVDFTESELTFLIGKEMCDIYLNHTYNYTLISETLNILNNSSIIGKDVLYKSSKAIMHKWCRIANYTSDAFGYIVCNDIKAAVSCIKKLILNNCYLADNMNLMQYIKQVEDINALDEDIYNYSKQDEVIPYGQFRIKSLISYASSKRGVQAIKEIRGGI